MKTEQVTKCCEPLQKIWVRLGACETGLSPLLFYTTDTTGDTSLLVLIVLCFGVELLCCLHLTCVYVFIKRHCHLMFGTSILKRKHFATLIQCKVLID